ncbi:MULTISPECIES: hypothetical protein [unclassified Vibrio]|uniref:hypothetical protein n=1 Tax=unclassified Vibrio TaxID=2614977 RepID=UPI00354F4A40
MGFFFAALVFVILSFFIVGVRAFKAQDRLQACIDNGKVQFDDYQIELSKGIATDERDKIENEISIY